MNMKNIKYILFTAAAGLCLTLASCSEDKYEPGPEPANDCMEAYFLSSNSSEYILGSESTSVTLEVGRLKADNAASIPVIVEAKDEAFKVPSTVEFQAGEATAELTVTFEGIEIQKEKKFTIRLADEYVNPYTGGASLVVTGPGPVLLAGCEVTFKDQAGNSYTKTSDALGYIYLDKDELPVWSEESPGAGDLSRRTRPERFRVGDKEITDPSLIAATCAVPYRVGVTVEMTDSEWRESTVDVKYDIARVVEGKTETSWSGIEYPHCDINSGQGYFFYRRIFTRINSHDLAFKHNQDPV